MSHEKVGYVGSLCLCDFGMELLLRQRDAGTTCWSFATDPFVGKHHECKRWSSGKPNNANNADLSQFDKAKIRVVSSPAPSNVKVNATKSEACSHLAAHCVPNEDTNLFSSLKVWCLALYSLPDNWGPSCCTQPDGLVHKICHSGQTWYMSKIGANVCASGLPVCRSVAGQKTIRSVKLLSFLYWPTHLEVKGFIMLRHFLSLEKHKHLNVVSFCLVKA